MFNRKLEPKLNKWQFIFRHGISSAIYDFAWREVGIGILKLTSLPQEGGTLTRKHYQGVQIQFDYWFPIRFKSY